MMKSKRKVWISIWWLLQLCGLVIMTRHLGHLLVDILLLSSLVGFVLGGRKTSIVASFGLAAYAALTFILALLLCYLAFEFGSWYTPTMVLIVAILNLIISFGTIKLIKNNLLY